MVVSFYGCVFMCLCLYVVVFLFYCVFMWFCLYVFVSLCDCFVMRLCRLWYCCCVKLCSVKHQYNANCHIRNYVTKLLENYKSWKFWNCTISSKVTLVLADRAKRLFPKYQQFFFWQTNLLSIVVELHQRGSNTFLYGTICK